MSYITDAMLFTGALWSESERIEKEVNAFFEKEDCPLFRSVPVEWGHKAWTAHVVGASCNYLDTGAFAEHLRTKVDWGDPRRWLLVLMIEDYTGPSWFWQDGEHWGPYYDEGREFP